MTARFAQRSFETNPRGRRVIRPIIFMIEENGIIKSTFLGVEDHGIFTAFLHIEFDGSGLGFGGYALDQHFNRADKSGRIGTAYGMEFIRQILSTLEVDSWENLPRKTVRVRRDDGKIHTIGHIVKNRWFTPATDLAHFYPET